MNFAALKGKSVAAFIEGLVIAIWTCAIEAVHIIYSFFLSLPWETLAALGTASLGAATVAGTFLLTKYRKQSHNLQSSKWISDIHNNFYNDLRNDYILSILEYHYSEKLSTLLTKRLTNREVIPSEIEIELLRGLDRLLNVLELVLYLRSQKQIDDNDMMAVFDYWFRLLDRPTYGELRLYIKSFGFDAIADFLCEKPFKNTYKENEYLFVSVKQEGNFSLTDLIKSTRLLPTTTIASIETENDFVADISFNENQEHEGCVIGNLYSIQSPNEVFENLDKQQEFNIQNIEQSKLKRRRVRAHLKSNGSWKQMDVWVYTVNTNMRRDTEIREGNSSKNLYLLKRKKVA